MEKLNATQARDQLPELVTLAATTGRRTVIEKRGKPVAAVVSYADLLRLEALDDARDSADLARAVAEATGFVTVDKLVSLRPL